MMKAMVRGATTVILWLVMTSVAMAQLTPQTSSTDAAPGDEHADSQAASTSSPPPPVGYLLTLEAPTRARRHRRVAVGGWPRLFLISVDFVFASVNYRGATFIDRLERNRQRGDTLRLRRFAAPGASMGLRLVPTRFVEFGLGLGVLVPQVGGPRLAMTTRRERVFVTGAHVAYWHGHLSLVGHAGAVAFSVGVRAGWSRMVIELGGDGPSSMRAARATAGPTIDLRAHLYRSLFVHLGGYADTLHWPDAQIHAGLGLAHR